jgi:hypothetical protein
MQRNEMHTAEPTTSTFDGFAPPGGRELLLPSSQVDFWAQKCKRMEGTTASPKAST